MSRGYSIGVDYGTNSVRALIVDLESGEEVATHVFEYPSGEDGILLDARDPNLARQNPADYEIGFKESVRGALEAARALPRFDAGAIVGIGTDTTGSTPVPVDAHCRPLASHEAWRDEPAAQAWLWKDHTSHAEAAEITEAAKRAGAPYLDKCGGVYSSEWFWSKIFHCSRVAPKAFMAAHSWVEQSDLIPAMATGCSDPARIKRNACAAGHKAMFAAGWGGLPSAEFLGSLSFELAELRGRLYDRVYTADQVAGGLCAEYAAATGLREGLPVAVGVMDAHAGAVASGVKPGTLVKIIGTSTCDTMVHPKGTALADVPGVCGIVDGSIIPGMIGIEAGQSAVGDIFNWFAAHLAPAEFSGADAHEKLSRAAGALRPGESGLLALDWNNGNRTILVDPRLTGLLIGQTLHTSAPEVYRALVEATAFGALRIIERLEEYGVQVREVVNCGGIAEKNAFVMQIYADVCNRPMKIAKSPQACALGAAIFGAVAGGAFATTEEAQARLGGVKTSEYRPDPGAAAVYARIYALYRRLHDAFGVAGQSGGLHDVMKELISIREEARR